MSDSPLDFDLKILPDWLKETGPKNPYANYAGESEDSRSYRSDWGERGARRDRGSRPGGRTDSRPDRRGGSGKPAGPRPGYGSDRPDRRSGGANRQGRRDGRPSDRPAHADTRREAAPHEESQPAHVTVEFLPEAHFVAGIVKLVRTSFRAYPLLDLARGFISKPERYRVRITARPGDPPLFQCGEGGPIALSRNAAIRAGFLVFRSQYYSMETVEGEEIKGNYSNVARHRLTGTLIGPTNHHSYQAGMRRLYEERFSRRMSFDDFKRGIEVVTDPAVIEAWKQEARSQVVYKTLKEEGEPLTFSSVADVEQHFRDVYAEKLLREGQSFEVSGENSRHLPDRSLGLAVRIAFDKQRGFPSQMIFHLRREMFAAGLHVFRMQKQAQYVNLRHPTPFKGDSSSLKESVAALLRVIESTPKCTRTEVAAALLNPNAEEPEATKAKADLAADLHWLIHSAHVVEFSDGHLAVPTKDWDRPHGQPAQREPQQQTAKAGSAEITSAPEAIAAEPTEPTEPEANKPLA